MPAARCSETMCSLPARVIVVYAGDESTRRYCHLCWEDEVMEMLDNLEQSGTLGITLERAKDGPALPIYRVRY